MATYFFIKNLKHGAFLLVKTFFKKNLIRYKKIQLLLFNKKKNLKQL